MKSIYKYLLCFLILGSYHFTLQASQPGHNDCSNPMLIGIYLDFTMEEVDGSNATGSSLDGTCGVDLSDNFFVFTATSESIEFKALYSSPRIFRYQLFNTNNQCNSSNSMTCDQAAPNNVIRTISGLQVGNKYVFRLFNPALGENLGIYELAFRDTENGSSVLSVGFMGIEGFAQQDGSNLLEWATASESNNAGFEVHRSIDATQWEILDFVKGQGSTLSITKYSWTDKQIRPSAYYRVVSIDYDGTKDEHKIIHIENNNILFGIYPNTLHPGQEVTIRTNTYGEKVRLFSMSGEEIFTYTKQNLIDHLYTSNLSAGMYIIKVGNLRPERIFIN